MHNQSNVEDWINCKATTGPSVYTVVTFKCIEENDDIIMPIDPGGNGGGGGSGTPPPNSPDGSDPPCTGTTIPTNPQPGFTDENGCSIGAPTLPNLHDPRDTPCKQLMSLGEKQYFKDRMGALKANVDNGTKEFGFVLHENSTTPVSQVLIGSADTTANTIDFGSYYQSLSNELANSLYGNAHNHLANDPEHVGIFPPDDLALLSLFGVIEALPQNPNYSAIPKKAVIYVITDKGLFALKINNLQKLKAYVIKYENMMKTGEAANYLKEMFQDEDGYNIQHDSTHDQLVTGFLRFIIDEDIGIDLYEGNKNTYQGWKKLELVNNGGGNYYFNEIPCNF